MGGSRSLSARPGLRLLLACGLMIVLADAPAVSAAVGRAAASPGEPASWRQVWSASFGGEAGAGINQHHWRYETGTGVFGTGEVERMTSSPSNVAVDGLGDLGITAVEQNGSWTSGRVQTRGTFAAPAGGEMMVTAAIRQPAPADGLGYWPAFWMIGPGSWPQTGELDIAEDVNALGEHSGTMHCGDLTQANGDGTFGPCHEYIGLTSSLLPCPGCQAGYHTYGIVLDRRDTSAEQIRWYLDGQQFFAVNEAQVGAAAWTQSFDHGLSLVLDLAIGGGYPDAICGCTTPTAQTTSGATMSVRDVAVYDSVPAPGRRQPVPWDSGW